MKPHPFDPFSLIFGLLFAIIGFAFLTRDIDANDIDPLVLGLVALLVIGLLLGAFGFIRTRKAAATAPDDPFAPEDPTFDLPA